MALHLEIRKHRHYTFKLHCMKSVQIRSFSWSVFYCIQFVYKKIRTRKKSIFGHFSRSASVLNYELKIQISTDIFFLEIYNFSNDAFRVMSNIHNGTL